MRSCTPSTIARGGLDPGAYEFEAVRIMFSKPIVRLRYAMYGAFARLEGLDVPASGLDGLAQIATEKVAKEVPDDGRFARREARIVADETLGHACVRAEVSVDFRTGGARQPLLAPLAYDHHVGVTYWCARALAAGSPIARVGWFQRFNRGDSPLPLAEEVGPLLKSLDFLPP